MIEYRNGRPPHYYKQLELTTRDDSELSVFSMRITHFGRLFLKACAKNVSNSEDSHGR
ncbi:hypothetical protein D9M69_608800 [compost metagenome]